MNPHFQALLRSGDAADIAAFFRDTPGQLDTDDVKEALAAVFDQIAELGELIRDTQGML